MSRVIGCCLTVLVLLIGCRKDVSGSYIASDQGSIFWLQLVRTPDDHLTGQLIASVLKPDGQIEHSSFSFTGAINGENITLIGGGFLGMQTTTLSGTFDRDTLTFTGVPSAPLVLRRKSIAEYQTLLGEQATRSQAIMSAVATAAARQQGIQNERDLLTELDQFAGHMQRFDKAADYHLNRFPTAEKGYEAITGKVNEYVAEERKLVGNPSRSVQRSQLSVAATQASLATDQLHFAMQSLQSSLQTNVEPMLGQATVFEQKCRQDAPPVGTVVIAAEFAARRSACSRVLTAVPIFREKYVAMKAGLTQLQQVYEREKDRQARLLVTAERME